MLYFSLQECSDPFYILSSCHGLLYLKFEVDWILFFLILILLINFCRWIQMSGTWILLLQRVVRQRYCNLWCIFFYSIFLLYICICLIVKSWLFFGGNTSCIISSAMWFILRPQDMCFLVDDIYFPRKSWNSGVINKK